MLKLLKYLVIVTLFTITTIFLTQNKGDIVINWMGYKIYTDVTFIVLAAIIVAILASLMFNVIKILLLPFTRQSNKTLLLLKKLVSENILNKQNITFILSDIHAGKISYIEMLSIYRALKDLHNNKNINPRVLRHISYIERNVKKNISIIASEIVFRRLLLLKENNKVIESTGRKGLTSKKISIKLLNDFSQYLIKYPNKGLLALCVAKFEQYFNEEGTSDQLSKQMYGLTVSTYIKLLQDNEIKKAILTANIALLYADKEVVFQSLVTKFAKNKQEKNYIRTLDRYIESVFSINSIRAWFSNYEDLEYNKIIAKTNKLNLKEIERNLLQAYISLKSNKYFECDNYLSKFPEKAINNTYRAIAVENYKRKGMTHKALELYEAEYNETNQVNS